MTQHLNIGDTSYIIQFANEYSSRPILREMVVTGKLGRYTTAKPVDGSDRSRPYPGLRATADQAYLARIADMAEHEAELVQRLASGDLEDTPANTTHGILSTTRDRLGNMRANWRQLRAA